MYFEGTIYSGIALLKNGRVLMPEEWEGALYRWILGV
jgi:hypothetical protein